MTIIGAHHFCIVVTDLDRTIAFYERLGMTVAKRFRNTGEDLGTKIFGNKWGVTQSQADLDQAIMLLDGVAVEFIQCLDPKTMPYHLNPSTAGSAHIAFHVEDIDTEVARLQTGGVEFHTPVNVHVGDDFTVKWCYLRDPDGICVELVEGPPFS